MWAARVNIGITGSGTIWELDILSDDGLIGRVKKGGVGIIREDIYIYIMGEIRGFRGALESAL